MKKLMNKKARLVFGLLILWSLPWFTLQAKALLTLSGNFGVDGCPLSLAIGDFNGDGKQDIVTVGTCSSTGSVTVLFGDGTGSFGSNRKFSAGPDLASVAIGDFNGDGKQDIVATDFRNDVVGSWLGDGTGNFTVKSVFVAGLQPVSIAISDFNGDGKQDLAVANSGYNSNFQFYVSILFGDGTGDFGSKRDLYAGYLCADPVSVAIGDFNGDMKFDISIAHRCPGTISIWLGDGTGNFVARSALATGAQPEYIVIGDFNDDMKQDLATSNRLDSTVSVFLGNGSGGFGTKNDFSVGSDPYSVATADFNIDGKQDLVTANSSDDTISILRGYGNGNFGLKEDFAAGDRPNTVAVGDFNGDGKPDLAVLNIGSNNVSIFLNDTASTISLPWIPLLLLDE